MDSTKKCRYCQNGYIEDGREHVFPKGMGGQDIFMNNVCRACNKKFSDYERALMRDSPIAFMRSVEGVEGYKHSNIPSGAFLAPILLTFDEEKKVVYEVGQRYPFENFVRPQILLIQDTFYIEGDSREHLQDLVDKFAKWKKEVKCIVLKRWVGETSFIEWIEFAEDASAHKAVGKPVDIIAKSAIKVDVLSETHGLFAHLSPRIYINDLGELWVRARSIEEVIAFLIKLINSTRVRVALNSYAKDTFTHPTIYVGQNFNNVQFSQGLVKIGVNCLMYYYPAFRDDEALNECISFVMTGKGGTAITGEMKDSIKDSGEGTHNLFFQQMSYGMNIRISFFNGAGGALSFNVMGLIAMAAGGYNRLVIDYKNRTMEFQDRRNFLMSFDQKHGKTADHPLTTVC